MAPPAIPLWEARALRERVFDEVIDVRSPTEFAEDHVPGALNLPVLEDTERTRVGTIYQRDPFAARKLGAVIVARNIARHIEGHFSTKPRGHRPLLYCWRGGQRSRSLALVLREIGWKPVLLEGGYKAYRANVRERLAAMCANARFHVVAGLTGTGKTRLLEWLATRGENVLDLERLAAHRGSLLGDEPDAPQPSQKWFESQLCAALDVCDPAREIFIESESKRIGRVFCPEPLWLAMIRSPVTAVTAPLAARVKFLLGAYEHFVGDPTALLAKLPTLIGPQSRKQVAEWEAQIVAGQWPEFVASLLEKHYDPRYGAADHFQPPSREVRLESLDAAGFAAAWLHP